MVNLHFHEFRVFTSQKCCLINFTVVLAVQINILSHFQANCAIEKVCTIVLIARKHKKYLVKFVLTQITDLIGRRKFPRLVFGRDLFIGGHLSQKAPIANQSQIFVTEV